VWLARGRYLPCRENVSRLAGDDTSYMKGAACIAFGRAAIRVRVMPEREPNNDPVSGFIFAGIEWIFMADLGSNLASVSLNRAIARAWMRRAAPISERQSSTAGVSACRR